MKYIYLPTKFANSNKKSILAPDFQEPIPIKMGNKKL